MPKVYRDIEFQHHTDGVFTHLRKDANREVKVGKNQSMTVDFAGEALPVVEEDGRCVVKVYHTSRRAANTSSLLKRLDRGD